MTVHTTVLAEPGAAEPPAVFVHGVLSWGTDERYGFGHQRPLASRRRLVLMDRRGHGGSPDVDDGPYRTDYEVDAEDVVDLLGDGAHLVGHSYGGVVALLAASRRPDLVRSLCLVQHGWMRAAENHPVVAGMLERARAATGEGLPPGLTPEEYLRLTTEPLGMEAPEPTPERLRAAWSTMAERPCWDAEIDIGPVADAPFPTLVVVGDWIDAPPEYERLVGGPLRVANRVLAERIGADAITVPGFYPQVQEPERVNAALAALWETGT